MAPTFDATRPHKIDYDHDPLYNGAAGVRSAGGSGQDNPVIGSGGGGGGTEAGNSGGSSSGGGSAQVDGGGSGGGGRIPLEEEERDFDIVTGLPRRPRTQEPTKTPQMASTGPPSGQYNSAIGQNARHVIARQAARQHTRYETMLQHNFSMFDIDASGTISLSELEQVLRANRPDIPSDVVGTVARHAMQAGDTSGDGKLSFDEFAIIHNDLIDLVAPQNMEGWSQDPGAVQNAVPADKGLTRLPAGEGPSRLPALAEVHRQLQRSIHATYLSLADAFAAIDPSGTGRVPNAHFGQVLAGRISCWRSATG